MTIRVLIADDSSTVRHAIRLWLGDAPDIEVVGEARDGFEAISLARSLAPDVITMDVLMPRLSGLDAIPEIMAASPCRILVVSSAVDDAELDLSFRAIQQGALEIIPKPTSDSGSSQVFGRKLVESVRLMAEVPVVRRARRTSSIVPHLLIERRLDAFALVASTGGPPVLATILGALPRALPVPIFVAQHMASGFVGGLVRWLAGMTPLDVVVATSGEVVRPGRVYLAPDGADLEIDREGCARVTPSGGGHCPSGDKLLGSVARAYGPRAGAAVLTGMGSDGAEGLDTLRRFGGVTLAQDEDSCVVFGMPKAARERGAAASLASPTRIAAVIRETCIHEGLGT